MSETQERAAFHSWRVEAASASIYPNGRQVITEWFVRRVEDDVAIASGIIDPDTSQPSQELAEHIAAAWNAEAERDAARERERVLWAALEFYADDQTWYHESYCWGNELASEDQGAIARKALAGVRGEEGGQG